MVIVLCRPGRGATHVEKSPHLNWVTQFLTVAYDGECYPNVFVRMARIFFGAVPKRKKIFTARFSLLLKCARRLTCFLSAFVARKDLQFST